MAKSSAKKRREQLLRRGKQDPVMQRGSWNGVKPVTRVKPNKKKDFIAYDYDRGQEQAS
jgi:hypothetical protein